ncbi:hypothetical protein PanWU01x14_305880, partial [Parasponia andersonii]
HSQIIILEGSGLNSLLPALRLKPPPVAFSWLSIQPVLLLSQHCLWILSQITT